MSLFIRNLKKYGKDITIQTRDNVIKNGLPDMKFIPFADVRALISTVKGVTVFDDTNIERVATHKICIQFIAGVTSEKWILFGSKRIKILTVENVCEANEKLVLMCTERGDDSKVVNQT